MEILKCLLVYRDIPLRAITKPDHDRDDAPDFRYLYHLSIVTTNTKVIPSVLN